MKCQKCLSEKVCRYNDGINLYCKDDYDCPHFKDENVYNKIIRGNWIREKRTISGVEFYIYKCSVCGREEEFAFNPYCNCGAKMND